MKPPKQTFCGSPACLEEWKIRTDPSYARAKVEERDRGICALCGFDTRRLDRLLRNLKHQAEGWRPPGDERPPTATAMGRAKRIASKFRGAGWNVSLKLDIGGHLRLQWSHLWEADHIVPVVEGGGETGLENLRTACTPCHKRVTAELRKRLKARRDALTGRSNLTLFAIEKTLEGGAQ